MGNWGLGLGRERTVLGEWLDRKGISQTELSRWTGLSQPTITNVCSVPGYRPSYTTKRTIIHALIKRGYDVEESDFW